MSNEGERDVDKDHDGVHVSVGSHESGTCNEGSDESTEWCQIGNTEVDPHEDPSEISIIMPWVEHVHCELEEEHEVEGQQCSEQNEDSIEVLVKSW